MIKMLQPPGLLEINRNGAFFWMVCWHNHEIAKMKSTILRKKKKSHRQIQSPFGKYYFCQLNLLFSLFLLLFIVDVEQTAHVFLEQQGRRKSQRKVKGGCQQKASGKQCRNCMKFDGLKGNGILIQFMASAMIVA